MSYRIMITPKGTCKCSFWYYFWNKIFPSCTKYELCFYIYCMVSYGWFWYYMWYCSMLYKCLKLSLLFERLFHSTFSLKNLNKIFHWKTRWHVILCMYVHRLEFGMRCACVCVMVYVFAFLFICVCGGGCVCECVFAGKRPCSDILHFRPWTHHQTWTSADWGDSVDGC